LKKIIEKYRKALRIHVGRIPLAVASELQNRELDEQDYELLLQLDNPNTLSQIPEKIIKTLPVECIRESNNLLLPGQQCRICLRPFKLAEFVRKLPICKHKFHLDCIDTWLLHSRPTCPIDNILVFNDKPK
jgi:E3 ubiquitin-protein ligase ZSWIM2